MKVGDLVKYIDVSAADGLRRINPGWSDWRGVIVRQIPGTGNNQVVFWANNNLKQSHEAKNLEVIKEKE